MFPACEPSHSDTYFTFSREDKYALAAVGAAAIIAFACFAAGYWGHLNSPGQIAGLALGGLAAEAIVMANLTAGPSEVARKPVEGQSLHNFLYTPFWRNFCSRSAASGPQEG